MSLVLSGNPLPAHYNDHALTGDMPGFRELHIGGDYLLIYRIDKTKDLLYLPTWKRMPNCLNNIARLYQGIRQMP